MACVGKSKSGGWYARHSVTKKILRRGEHPQGGYRRKKDAKKLAAAIARDNGASVSWVQIGECDD